MTTPATASRLSIHGLTKTYEGSSAPSVASLSIDSVPGEFISLLGPSGCGKTTTLRCVAGFENPDTGAILLNDADVTRLPPEGRSFGMVFQSYALFPHLSVYRNLAFGLEMRGIDRVRIRKSVDEALAMVQLSDLAERFPRQLSGGQQQRVALARALVIEPRLLLLDEPLANLDAILRDDMRGFIRSLQQRIGVTTLYVTHDQSEALAMSDRVAVMLSGRLLQFDTPEGVYFRPATEEVAGFIGKSNLLRGQVQAAEPVDGGLHRCTVQTPIGLLDAFASTEPARAASVLVSVRPEALSLRSGGELAGEVKSSYFSGNVVDHVVEHASGQTLLVQCSPADRAFVGERVSLAVNSSRTWVIPEGKKQ